MKIKDVDVVRTGGISPPFLFVFLILRGDKFMLLGVLYKSRHRNRLLGWLRLLSINSYA